MTIVAKPPSVIDRLLNLLAVFAQIAIVVILALILVEFKKFGDSEKGIVLRGANDRPIQVALSGYSSLGGNSGNPFWVEAVKTNN